jgi:hypothetical protein
VERLRNSEGLLCQKPEEKDRDLWSISCLCPCAARQPGIATLGVSARKHGTTGHDCVFFTEAKSLWVF